MYDTKWTEAYLNSRGYNPNGSTERDHQGFFVGQQVWERDTLAPGTITDIDEDGIATVLFTNGNTDGVILEDLMSECALQSEQGENAYERGERIERGTDIAIRREFGLEQ